MENIKSSGSGKCFRNTLDIYNLMSRIPPRHLPIFVSANLARLPSLDPDVYDISALSQQVNDIRKGNSEQNVFVELKNEVSALKEQLSDLHIPKTQVAEITNHLSAS